MFYKCGSLSGTCWSTSRARACEFGKANALVSRDREILLYDYSIMFAIIFIGQMYLILAIFCLGSCHIKATDSIAT